MHIVGNRKTWFQHNRRYIAGPLPQYYRPVTFQNKRPYCAMGFYSYLNTQQMKRSPRKTQRPPLYLYAHHLI